jgi:hypothetical protein
VNPAPQSTCRMLRAPAFPHGDPGGPPHTTEATGSAPRRLSPERVNSVSPAVARCHRHSFYNVGLVTAANSPVTRKSRAVLLKHDPGVVTLSGGNARACATNNPCWPLVAGFGPIFTQCPVKRKADMPIVRK